MTRKAWMPVIVAVAAAAMLAAPATAAKPEATSAPASQPVQKITVAQAAILGVVEGITEYLPVSSTGHLILAGNFLGLSHTTDEQTLLGRKIQKDPALDAFDIVIQLGAILAVLGLYRRRVGQMCKGLVGQSPDGLRLLGLLLLAFVPAAVAGLLLHHKIEEHLFAPVPVTFALVIGGLLMIVVEDHFWLRSSTRKRTTDVGSMQYWQALAIGMAQCLSLWPGTSRSMITIIAALIVGLDMLTAAEFSFLLALPTLGAATLYSGYKQWHELLQVAGPLGIAVGLVVSGIVAAIAVKGFVRWLTRHGLVPFGIYRILLGAGLFIWFVVLDK